MGVMAQRNSPGAYPEGERLHRDEQTHKAEGVDLSVIRWMLSLTPAERLQVLQKSVQSLVRPRDGKFKRGLSGGPRNLSPSWREKKGTWHHFPNGTLFLTGLVDFTDLPLRKFYSIPPPYDLKTFVGVEKIPGLDPHPKETWDISKALEDNGCVAPQ
jgi:hypothetical protein